LGKYNFNKRDKDFKKHNNCFFYIYGMNILGAYIIADGQLSHWYNISCPRSWCRLVRWYLGHVRRPRYTEHLWKQDPCRSADQRTPGTVEPRGFFYGRTSAADNSNGDLKHVRSWAQRIRTA